MRPVGTSFNSMPLLMSTLPGWFALTLGLRAPRNRLSRHGSASRPLWTNRSARFNWTISVGFAITVCTVSRPLHDRGGLHVAATDLPRDVGVVGRGGDDLQVRPRRLRPQQGEQESGRE